MTSETIQEGVRTILARYPEARNSYNWLWYHYCREICGVKLFIPFEALNGKAPIPSVESITRACRKIQNEELVFRPAFEIQQARAQKEQKVKEWATKTAKIERSQLEW